MINSHVKLCVSPSGSHLGRVVGIEGKVKSKFCFTERWWKDFISKKAFELRLEVAKRSCLLFVIVFLDWTFIELTEPAGI